MSKSALKILEAAEQLFNAQSFVGVGVDLIRDQSGCSKTTLYSHFKNKDQLIASVLQARDEKFKQSLLQSIGTAQGYVALEKILDWHLRWFQQDRFKGCLFVRAVAESNQDQHDVLSISQQHKAWIKTLIYTHCAIAQRSELSELVYTLLEGMIARFLVDGFDAQLGLCLKQNMLTLLQTVHNDFDSK